MKICAKPGRLRRSLGRMAQTRSISRSFCYAVESLRKICPFLQCMHRKTFSLLALPLDELVARCNVMSTMSLEAVDKVAAALAASRACELPRLQQALRQSFFEMTAFLVQAQMLGNKQRRFETRVNLLEDPGWNVVKNR